jgi:hypothetical protein
MGQMSRSCSYLLRLRMGLRISRSNHFSMKCSSDYMKKEYIDTIFHLEVECLLNLLILLGCSPSILMISLYQYIPVLTVVNASVL